MLRIHQAIQSGGYPNATSLARDLEVSTKSIYRDLDFMRDRFNLPLEYNSGRFGFYYTEPVSEFPLLEISQGELVALLIAEKSLQQYRGTPFEKPLLSALEKIAAALPSSVSLSLADWERTVSFHTSTKPIIELGVLDVLARATVNCQQLQLTYRKPGCPKAEARIVDPYHLANVNGEWFLFAYCHLRHDLRTFVPSRIVSVVQTGKSFARPRRFSLEERLQSSFGVHSGRGQYQVIIRFKDTVADYIREKNWHPSQQLRERPNGDLDLRLKLSSLVKIQRWILGWAGNARVLQPPELVAAVKKAAEAMRAVYA